MMSEQWPVKKLGELCTIVNGGTPKSKISEYWGGDILTRVIISQF